MTVTQEALDVAQNFVGWMQGDPEAGKLLEGQNPQHVLTFQLLERGCTLEEADLIASSALGLLDIPRQREEL